MREVSIGNRIGENYNDNFWLKKMADELWTIGTFTVDAAAQLQGKNQWWTSLCEKQWRVTKAHVGSKGSENNSNAMATMKMEITRGNFQIAFQAALQPYFKMERSFVLVMRVK